MSELQEITTTDLEKNISPEKENLIPPHIHTH